MGQIYNLTPEAIEKKVEYETKQAEFSEQNRELFKVRKELAEVATLGRAMKRTSDLGVYKGDHFVDEYGIATDFQDPLTAGGYGAALEQNKNITWKSAEEYEDFFPREEIIDSLYWQSLSPEAQKAVEPRIPPEGARMGYVNEIARRKDREVYLQQREKTLVNELQLGGATDTANALVAGFAATLTDPAEWAINFIPVGGWASKIPGTKTLARRTAGRVMRGSVEGLFGAAVAEPGILYAADLDGADYDIYDSYMNLLFSPVIGATMHTTLGSMGDMFNLNINEKTAVNRKAVADLFGDGPVNVVDHIATERNMAAANTLEAIEMENRFLYDLVDGNVKDAGGERIILNEQQRAEATEVIERNILALDAGDPNLSRVEHPGQAMKEPPEYGSVKDDYHVNNADELNQEYTRNSQEQKDFEEAASAWAEDPGEYRNSFAEETERMNAEETARKKSSVVDEEEPLSETSIVSAMSEEQTQEMLNRTAGHKTISDELEVKKLAEDFRLHKESGDDIRKHVENGDISLNRKDKYTEEIRNLQQSQVRADIMYNFIRKNARDIMDVEDIAGDKTVQHLISRLRRDTRMAAQYTVNDIGTAIRELQTKTNKYIAILSKRAKGAALQEIPVLNKATGKVETRMVTSSTIKEAAIDLAAKELKLENSKRIANFAQAFIKSELAFDRGKNFIDTFIENNPKATWSDAYFAYMGTDIHKFNPFYTRAGARDIRLSTDLRQESASANLKNGLLAELRANDLDPFVIANEGPFHLSGTARDAVALLTVGKAEPSGVKTARVKGKKLSPRQMEADIVQEMWNLDFDANHPRFKDTGNTKAKEIAELFNKYLEVARTKQNALGANIDKLLGRVVSQTHNIDAMLGSSLRQLPGVGNYDTHVLKMREQWKDFILPLLDGERTFKGADPDEWLNAAWDHIIKGRSEMLGAWDPSMYRSTENFGDAISKSRKMHFNSPTEWLEYNRKFGSGDVFSSVMKELEHAGKNIGLMETHGPDPYAFHNRMKNHIERSMEKAGKPGQAVKFNANRLDNLFNEVNGSLDIPGNRLGAVLSSNARAVANMAYLPRVIFSVPADLTQWSALQRRMGVRWLDRMVNVYLGTGARIGKAGLGNIFTGWSKRGPVSLSEKDMSKALALGFDYMLNTSAAKYNLVDQPGRFFQRAQDRFFKLNLLQDWDAMMKTATVISLSNMMDKFSGKSWGQLNKANTLPLIGSKSGYKFTKELQHYGIGKEQWGVIRKASEEIEGSRLKTAQSVRNLTPEEVRKYNPKLKDAADADVIKFRDETAERLQMFYIDSARTAVPTPGAAQRAMGKLGTQRGTIKGEIMRNFWQFKAFMSTIMTRTWGRELEGGFIKGGSAIGGTFAAATMLGLLSNVLNARSKGERYWNKVEEAYNEGTNLGEWGKAWKIAGEAAARGGGLGFYGDLIFADPKERARKGIAGAVGPSIQLADELAVKLPYAWLNYAMSDNPDRDLKAKSLRSLFRYTPILNFTQLAYTKAAFDGIVFNEKAEELSPGYNMRMRRRAYQRDGTEYWLKGPISEIDQGPDVEYAPRKRSTTKEQDDNYRRFKDKYGNKKIFF